MDLNEFYEKYYRPKSESWIVKRNHAYTHQKLERNINNTFENVLELGAGNGEHFHFVRHPFKTYLLSDLRQNIQSDIQDGRVRFESFNAERIPYVDNSFQRVLSTCLLHHVADVRGTLEEMRRVSTHGGLISISIAADPGLTYRLFWRLTSGRRLRNQGLRFPISVHYQEHRGHFIGIREIAREIFADDAVSFKFYPFTIIPNHQVNIFAVMQIHVDKMTKQN
jgi:SAM-dependent methyltransferase